MFYRKISKLFNKHPLLIIVLIASITRLLFLDSYPWGTNVDEAAKAYNAYSLISTGKTFRNTSWPAYTTDFSLYQPAFILLYQYSLVPFIYLFGINLFATRLPAAIFGILSVLCIYKVSMELFKEKTIASISAFLLAMSPWHILLSRIGFEPTSYLFFFLLGFYLCLKSLHNIRLLPLGFISLGISIYAYQSSLLILPTFILLFCIFNLKTVLNNKMWVLLAIVTLFIVTSPMLYQILFNPLYAGHFEHTKITDPYKILVNYVYQFATLYWYYPFTYITATIGGLTAIRFKKYRASILLLGIMIIVSVIPAGLTYTKGIASMTRTSPIIGLVELIAGVGIFILWNKLPKILIFAGIVEYILLSVVILTTTLRLNSPIIPFGFGYKLIGNYLAKNETKYDNIYFYTNTDHPFIYLLFYLKYPPSKFLSDTVVRAERVGKYPYDDVISFGKFHFCEFKGCQWDATKRNLFIVDQNYISQVHVGKILTTIKSEFGNVYYVME